MKADAVARADVTEIGAVLVAEADGRRSAGDITLFDSTGLAIQDLTIAKAASADYASAARAGNREHGVSESSGGKGPARRGAAPNGHTDRA